MHIVHHQEASNVWLFAYIKFPWDRNEWKTAKYHISTISSCRVVPCTSVGCSEPKILTYNFHSPCIARIPLYNYRSQNIHINARIQMPMGGIWGGTHNKVHSSHPNWGHLKDSCRKCLLPHVSRMEWFAVPSNKLLREVEDLTNIVALDHQQNVAYATLTLRDIQIIGMLGNILQHVQTLYNH